MRSPPVSATPMCHLLSDVAFDYYQLRPRLALQAFTTYQTGMSRRRSSAYTIKEQLRKLNSYGN